LQSVLLKNFGFKKGAIASTVAHDSHNIVAVGVDDQSLCNAINKLIECEGGVSVAFTENDIEVNSVLPLPVAGLMSTNDGYKVAEQYTQIDKMAKDLGSTLSAPFMTLFFYGIISYTSF
jgi:adenine deaminase